MAAAPNTALDGRPMQVIVLANPDGTLQTPGSIINTTSPQLTVGYDATDKLTVGVSAAGATTFTAAGTAPTFTFTTGTDSATTVNIGSGGTPTAARIAKITINSPSGAAGLLGSSYIEWTRASASPIWTVGIDQATVVGAKTANTDLYFQSQTGYVGGFTTAGALTTASSITVQAGGINVTGGIGVGTAPVSQFGILFGGTIAASGGSGGVGSSSANVNAAANSDTIYGLRWLGTYSANGFTTVGGYGLYVTPTWSLAAGTFGAITGMVVQGTYVASAGTNTGIEVGPVSGGATANLGLRVRTPTGTGAVGIQVDGAGASITGGITAAGTGASSFGGGVTFSGAGATPTATFYDATATTGYTQIKLRSGAGQSGNNLISVRNNADNATIFSLGSDASVGLAASAKIASISGVIGHSVVSTAYTLGSAGTVVLPNANMSGAANDAARDVLAGNIDGAIAIDTGVAGRIYIRDAGAWKFALAT